MSHEKVFIFFNCDEYFFMAISTWQNEISNTTRETEDKDKFVTA